MRRSVSLWQGILKLFFWTLLSSILATTALAQMTPADSSPIQLRTAPQSLQESYFQSFASQRIQFPGIDAEKSFGAGVSPGRYPQALKFILQKVLSWNPEGHWGSYSAACEPSLWSQHLQDPRLNSIQLQGALVEKYLKQCASEVKTSHTWDWVNTLKIMTMQFSTDQHPFLHRILFQLPGAIRLKGFMALKGDYKKRPLIVVRLGIFSSAEDFLPERYLLMQLFEQSPFNVLVIENMTGPDFIANNDRFSFGGYDEGLQNILMAQLLRDPLEPISRLVGSLHFAGVSLGGHGVLFASLLNETNRSARGEKLIDSFMGFCPVVHLKPTTEHLDDQGLRSRVINFWSAQRLTGLRQKIPQLTDTSDFYFMPQMISVLRDRYHGGLSYVASVKLPPGMKDTADFWAQNDYWKYYQNVTSPVMVWATHKDPVVPYNLNSATLQGPNIRMVQFAEGLHCTLPIAYRWEVITSLMQGYFLSHSKDFSLQTKVMEIEPSEKNSRRAGRLGFEVIWKDKSDKFVRIKIGDQQLSLPLADFDFRFLNDKLSGPEQRMLERWLQQNLFIENDQSQKKLKLSWQIAAPLQP